MRTIWVVLTLGAACGWAACVTVEGDRIHGRELAVAHEGFASMDQNADLGPAPATGTRRTFRHFELERLARATGVQLEESDPREVCFERSVSHLSEEILQPVLSAAIHGQDGFENTQVEIIDFSRQSLPLGTPEFLASALDRSGMWHGRMIYGENRSVPVWARVRIADPSGRTIVTGKTSRDPEIAKGDRVHAEILSGAVLLAFDATAESSGHIGEQVTVRNPINGQRIRVFVEAKGKVKIQK